MAIILDICIQMNTFVYMTHTVSIRMEKNLYQSISKVAKANKRSISNYIEYAMERFVLEESFVSDEEMAEILSHKDFAANVKTAKKQIKSKEVRFV
ncbi:MAG: CopG family transcriptional regulator [Leptospiraceae bacterium]|nr:CopG family transcriptional regulator [Leptospiraceae bacterium]